MKKVDIEVKLIDVMGSDLSIVNAARVSFDKESDFIYDESGPILDQRDEKLIHYLAKHKHKSPFNHAFLSFRVKAPIFVARQLVKHEYLPWNEVSRRYVDDEPEFWFPEEWRGKSENVKQGSGGALDEQEHISHFVKAETFRCLINYLELLSKGVAPELARMILPQNTMTEWIWSGSLFAFMKMVKLRLDPHAQQESREVAQLVYDKIAALFPVSAKALMEYGE